MADLTERQLGGYKRMAQAVMAKNEQGRKANNRVAARIVAEFHRAYPGVPDELLAKAANMITTITSAFQRMTLCELHDQVDSMNVSYALAAAYLAGVHEIDASVFEEVSAEIQADEEERAKATKLKLGAEEIGQYL